MSGNGCVKKGLCASVGEVLFYLQFYLIEMGRRILLYLIIRPLRLRKMILGSRATSFVKAFSSPFLVKYRGMCLTGRGLEEKRWSLVISLLMLI